MGPPGELNVDPTIYEQAQGLGAQVSHTSTVRQDYVKHQKDDGPDLNSLIRQLNKGGYSGQTPMVSKSSTYRVNILLAAYKY